VEALWRGIGDRTIDYIATDHAPQASGEKEIEKEDLLQVPPGIIGLETLLPLLLNARAEGRLQLTDIVRLCSEGPAREYGLHPRKGSIMIGADADLVVVDLEKRWRIDARRFYSRGDRGPFDGWEVIGAPSLTLVRGRRVMEDGVVASDVCGEFITPAKTGSSNVG